MEYRIQIAATPNWMRILTPPTLLGAVAGSETFSHGVCNLPAKNTLFLVGRGLTRRLHGTCNKFVQFGVAAVKNTFSQGDVIGGGGFL